MRDWERLRKMKEFFLRELCQGREFKSPAPQTGQKGKWGPGITDFTLAEPRVFIAFQPLSPNEPGKADSNDPYSVCPAITIMPALDQARFVEEKSLGRLANVRRSQDMGQGLTVQLLFGIYEPGVRYPGFAEKLESRNPDMALLHDGTEEGLKTLLNWMDDAKELLLRERTIPGTDLALEDRNFTYSLYTEQSYVVDRRPLYYGFLNVPFKGYANQGSDHGMRTRVDRLLDEDFNG